jgi:hypothetical protein
MRQRRRKIEWREEGMGSNRLLKTVTACSYKEVYIFGVSS